MKESIGDPANLSAAIGYYRALFDPARHRPGLRRGPGGVGVVLRRNPPCTCTVPTTAAMGLDAIGDVRSVLSAGLRAGHRRTGRALPPPRATRRRRCHTSCASSPPEAGPLTGRTRTFPGARRARPSATRPSATRRARSGSSGQPHTRPQTGSAGPGPTRRASTRRPRPWRSDPRSGSGAARPVRGQAVRSPALRHSAARAPADNGRTPGRAPCTATAPISMSAWFHSHALPRGTSGRPSLRRARRQRRPGHGPGAAPAPR